MHDSEDIGIDGWRDLMIKLAQIVTVYPKFLPLYERAEREFLARQDGSSVLDRAMRIAGAVKQNGQQGVQHHIEHHAIDH